ncbi:MAG: class E sortase [Acidimicrobiia bacterium]|nr:class E sortase [Acidimicrobiia bacterium]
MTAVELADVGDDAVCYRLPDAVDDQSVATPQRVAGVSTRTAALVWILVTVSALSLWGLGYGRVLGAVQEHRSQHELAATLREQLAKGTLPIGGRISSGAPIATLRAPSVGIARLVIVEGTAASTLELGPGHRRDTPLPGQPGVSVLMGRSVLFGAPFADIAKLHRGADMTLVTGQGTFHYQVEGVRRAGDPLPDALAPGESRLTLVTSQGSGSLFGGWTRRTVYADARLTDKAQPSSGAAPRSIRQAEAAMAGDERALLPLVAWLLLTTFAIAAAAWSHARWGLRQTLLVAVPVLVACAWVVTQTAARLLPNLL